MCGGKAPKQKPSANEIALAQVAAVKDKQFEQDFFPLEVFEIEQFQDPAVQRINRDILGGRANADVALGERDALRGLRRNAASSGTSLSSGVNVTAFEGIGRATALGVTAGKVEADQSARQIHDEEGLAVVRTGQNVSRTASSGLATLARQDNFKASQRVRDKLLVQEARAKALGDVASAGIVRGAREYEDFKRRKEAQKEANAANMTRGVSLTSARSQGMV